MIFKRPIITPYRRVNDLLLLIKELWSRVRLRAPIATAPRPRRRAAVTILAGDLSAFRPGQLSDISRGEAEVLGFRFAGPGALPGSRFETIELEGCAFPRFHQVLVSALFRISGSRLLVVSPDLTGLGLGLLHNYHFGTPLALVAAAPSGKPGPDPDWGDPEFLDPAGEGWRRYLAAFAGRVPESTGGDVAVLEEARQFAEAFAEFYRKTRSGP